MALTELQENWPVWFREGSWVGVLPARIPALQPVRLLTDNPDSEISCAVLILQCSYSAYNKTTTTKYQKSTLVKNVLK